MDFLHFKQQSELTLNGSKPQLIDHSVYKKVLELDPEIQSDDEGDQDC